jgi:hypothetical protein
MMGSILSITFVKTEIMKLSTYVNAERLVEAISEGKALLNILQAGTLPVDIKITDSVMRHEGQLGFGYRTAMYIAVRDVVNKLEKEFEKL